MGVSIFLLAFEIVLCQTMVYFYQTLLGDSFSVSDCPVSQSSVAELISS